MCLCRYCIRAMSITVQAFLLSKYNQATHSRVSRQYERWGERIGSVGYRSYPVIHGLVDDV
ncbi:hypothetical protein [Moraxella lacunata]|uniref:hypothetical protein n=1 Tax=Moraxella lacunata TaxID=477 RepID=UPI003EE1B2AE